MGFGDNVPGRGLGTESPLWMHRRYHFIYKLRKHRNVLPVFMRDSEK